MRRLALVFALLLLAAPAAVRAQVYDPTLAFNPITNPNGPWGFGYKAGLLGALIPFTVGLEIDDYYGPGSDYGRWSDGSTYGGVYYVGDVNAGGGDITLHPLAGDEQGVLRFTAPSAGMYAFDGFFQYSYFTTSDVYVVRNNSTTLFSGLINGGSPVVPFLTTLSMTPGETIDFQVGSGGNGYLFDGTYLRLGAGVSRTDLIDEDDDPPQTTTPEPATWMLIATGLGALAWHRRRAA